jgi:NADH-quinone oxidoreductase subunit G
LQPNPFVAPIGNFYMTDPISRASETMAQCTATFGARGAEKAGAAE